MMLMRQILCYSAAGLCHDDVSDEMMMKTSSCFSFSSPEKSDRAVVAVKPLLCCAVGDGGAVEFWSNGTTPIHC